jgi:hypothetical protein
MKIIKSAKGISTVLTVLLLVAVSVVSALITQIWVITYVENTMTKVKHVIWIPSVKFIDVESITVYVQNIGKGSVLLSTVYINTSLVGEEDITMSDDGVIEAGETCTITIINQSLTKNEKVRIKVVSIDGVSTEGVFRNE